MARTSGCTDMRRTPVWHRSRRTATINSSAEPVFPQLGACSASLDLLAGLAVQWRTLGAELRVCALPDCAELLARVGVPLVPIGGWR